LFSTSFNEELRNQYTNFRAAVYDFGQQHNIFEQYDLEPIDNDEVFGPLKFLDFPFHKRVL
jgi:hypothetical protein